MMASGLHELKRSTDGLLVAGNGRWAVLQRREAGGGDGGGLGNSTEAGEEG